ncbi:16S rRNA (guanine(527)-N(7))-methyltransferase RsmG [Sporolactobacillus putidus]|uniref:Ribosomal RNA small subunit methyltransferase G n=1 Tax=Sporolactobacillus putidus TaxID=492735 RepID=A0A917W334_9BACL|nr:16S rRNA (guanine(527)-N(7))-methyltransferase RsmG [Sporolactobacillus putidus]GGL57806.1 ribosomal RNA small subunit methyltransferase G [Sporolactobacillus putidus]
MKLLEQMFLKQDVHLSESQKEQFDIYYEKLLEWNNKMNLTAITDETEVAIKHFYDSITPSFYFSFSGPLKICDVGSGAGFPGIPLKILFPEIELTIVDSLNKRLTFLQVLTESLQMREVTLCHDRAEIFAHRPGKRESFDIVTARAVADLSVLSEYCLPLVSPGGTFIALKGAHAEEELDKADHAIHILGGKLEKKVSLVLPQEDGQRTLFFIRKTGETPKKYPRKPGIPAKNPL